MGKESFKVVCFLLAASLASELIYVDVSEFSVISIFIVCISKKNNTNNIISVILLAYTTYDDGTECSETSAYKIQTPGNKPNEGI